MLSKVSNTLVTKFLLALTNMLTIVVITKILGAEGRGEIGLFVANMTLIIHFCSIVGGSAIAYLAPRKNKKSLLLPSYIWTITICFLGTYSLFFLEKINSNQVFSLLAIGILNGFNTTNLTLLLGRNQIQKHNYLALLQPILLLTGIGFIFLISIQNIEVYYLSLLLSFLFTFVLSLYFVLKQKDQNSTKASLQEIFNYGLKAQGANIAQFINYRLCYYFIADQASLGIYANAIALAEGLWILSRSLATVQYAKVINSQQNEDNVTLSLSFIKISFIGTIVGVLTLILLPSEFFTFLFNKDFSTLPTLFLYMSPGIIAIALAANFSAYFGGIGKFEYSLYSSLLGMFITIIGCYTLVKQYNILGACITTSISYSLLTLYLIITFLRTNNLSISAFFIGKKDITMFKELISNKQ